ncbi:MAG TPA: hypothetical protein VHW04_16970 [Solirubrobacteraceae bacterium]|nr:hypothetical protein [Solirubrobacteraceae bacterium]
MTWGFLWLMLALKLPLAALIYIVWWAIKQEPEEDTSSSDDDGGVKLRPRPHPPRPFPRRPRRGPHGDPAPQPPARVRTTRARARTLGH